MSIAHPATDLGKWIGWAAWMPEFDYRFTPKEIVSKARLGLCPVFAIPADLIGLIDRGLDVYGKNPIGMSPIGTIWFDADGNSIGASACQMYGEDCIWTTAKPPKLDEQQGGGNGD